MVDFIADLHLHASDPDTFATWQRYMARTSADAVFILGDLFEVWVGDDSVDAAAGQTTEAQFLADCVAVLREVAERMPVYFMHGNRDFLIGHDLMARCGTTLLADPSVLVLHGQRWLLSHGDELCIGDTEYQAFRKQVRSPEWQRAFFGKPLPERQTIARELRRQSDLRRQQAPAAAAADALNMDVDPNAARAWLDAANAEVLIHGHTHKPGQHDLGQERSRIVLSDWDLQRSPPRAEVLRLARGALQRVDLVRRER